MEKGKKCHILNKVLHALVLKHKSKFQKSPKCARASLGWYFFWQWFGHPFRKALSVLFYLFVYILFNQCGEMFKIIVNVTVIQIALPNCLCRESSCAMPSCCCCQGRKVELI